jgi:phage terminase small subunit
MGNRLKADARQEIFIREYLKDLNATRAAIAVGYSEKTARAAASRLLTNVDIKKRVEEALAKKTDKLDITIERVLGELSKLAFSNMLDYMNTQEDGSAYTDLSKLTREQAAAIQEVTVDEYTEGRGENSRNVKRTRVKLADKRGSLELLGKYLKLFTDKQEISGDANNAIRVEIIHVGSKNPPSA